VTTSPGTERLGRPHHQRPSTRAVATRALAARTEHLYQAQNQTQTRNNRSEGENIRGKYAKLTRRIISADRQAAIENAVLHLDTLDDVAQLTALLTPAVHSPLG